MNIYTVICQAIKTSGKCCFDLVFVLENVDAFFDGFTIGGFSCVRTKDLLYVFRSVHDSSGGFRALNIPGCTLLITCTSVEKMEEQYDKLTFAPIERIGFFDEPGKEIED